MQRHELGPAREDWIDKIVQSGVVYWQNKLPDGSVSSYWSERDYYTFGIEEVLHLEEKAATLFQMLISAGDYVVSTPGMMDRLAIPKWAQEQVARTWETEPPSVYARYDIRYGGNSELVKHDPSLATPKLLEFNADTPTMLVESALAQWHWHAELMHGSDQWNSIHEKLIEAWKRNLAAEEQRLGYKPTVYFGCSSFEDSGEDLMTVQYLRDTADQAGYSTKTILMEDIEWQAHDGRFYDGDEHIDVIFKLWPWEFLTRDQFGKRTFIDLNDPRGTTWIEPPYKMLWSNKGILPVLWDMYKDDPERRELLLPSYFEEDKPKSMKNYARKPLLGREGANVTIVRDGDVQAETTGIYGQEGYICQEFAPLPNFQDISGGSHHPVLGVWMIDGEPAGLGIRESSGLITDNVSTFVPHAIKFA